MQTNSGRSKDRRRVVTFPILAFMLLAASACSPTVSITVNPDGTFTPSSVDIQAGQSILWHVLSPTDAIVQIGDPAQFPTSDPCGIADDDLDHLFAAADSNEFTGPLRKGVSGIFVLGNDERGFVQRLSTETCACELETRACTPREVASLDGNTYKLCPAEGAISEFVETTWGNPDVTGVIVRLDWKAIQIDDNGAIEYVWDDLDAVMNKAVENGKVFTLDISAGKNGTPDWIFSDYAGPAGPGPVTPHDFKDWGSESTPPFNNCGYEMTLGSPADTSYRDLYASMIEALADHVASDSRWFQALAHVKISGANLLTSEARLPKRCYDGDGDGILDTIGRDDCLCNSKIWADTDYTPQQLYEYYRVIGNTIYEAFYQRKSLGYQLIQAGFPRVESATNFEGDALRDQSGRWLLDSLATTTDDINGVIQTEQVLQTLREGEFIDPYGGTVDTVIGKLFVPQHSGLGPLPDDDGLPACGQAAAVDPATQKSTFPIASGVSGDGSAGCPNRWAVDEGTLYSQIMGFQTANPARVDSSDAVESTLWNLTINSNGVFIELYEQLVWEIYHTQGAGPTAAVLDSNRPTLVSNPAPYSKNLHTWTEELHERREALVDDDNPHTYDPFPPFHHHTFSKAINAPETYYYINPSKCALTTSPDRVGQINVMP